MALYTSYYNNRKLPADIVRVGISVTIPQGYSVDERIPFLSPDSSVLWGYKAGNVSDAEYTEKYVARLDSNKGKVEQILSGLEQKYPGRDVVLLCWCGPGKFCHRHILEDWSRKILGIEMSEWGEKRRQVVGDDVMVRDPGRKVRVSVVGSRGFGDYDLLKEFLDAELGKFPAGTKFELVSGGARGADSLAERYGKEKGIPVRVFAADWNRYGKSAGFRRNVDIIENCDFCVAFWDGQSRGTSHDFSLCEEKGKPYVVNLYLSGKVERHGVFSGPSVFVQTPEGVGDSVEKAAGNMLNFGYLDDTLYYKGNVPVAEDVVFCFGSNPVGINGNPARGTGGAALVACQQFGVRQGERMNNCMASSGRAYGIVTVTYPGKKRSVSLEEIRNNFGKMYECARRYPQKKFCVAYRHLDKPSLNGYTGREIMDAIKGLEPPVNVYFSEEWAKEMNAIRLNETVGKSFKR